MESQPQGGGDSNPTFQIVDWNYEKWDMRIDTGIPNDTAPGFTMTDIGMLAH